MKLDERCQLAKRWKADAFISIHMNSTKSSSAAGTESYAMTTPRHASTHSTKPESKTYAGNKHNAANTILAYKIQDNMISKLKTTDRGVKRARFAVLKNAPCPATLIECGFLSNATTERQFEQTAYRKKTAKAIANGILQYLDDIKRAKLEDEQVPR